MFWLAALLVALTVAVLLFWALRLRRRPVPVCLPQRYGPPPATPTWRFVAGCAPMPLRRDSPLLADQPAAFRDTMQAAGRRLRRAGVKLVVFVHGTFVGTDPLSLFEALRQQLFGLSPDLVERLRTLMRSNSERLVGDVGNFTAGYISLFREALGGDIPCLPFVWSSGNHHLARLRGAVDLARTLAGALPRGRVLLVGHSHAGQVFALLSQLVAGADTAEPLLDIAVRAGEDGATARRALEHAARLSLDFVTLGTPPRYGWVLGPRRRLLNLINHRGKEPLAGRLAGALFTSDGDYIQQWGIAGSDLLSASPAERLLNAELDRLLGEGADPRAWMAHLAHRVRVPAHGETLLVDFGDAAPGRLPNCISTLFGHGVYTRLDQMAPITRLIVEQLYG